MHWCISYKFLNVSAQRQVCLVCKEYIIRVRYYVYSIITWPPYTWWLTLTVCLSSGPPLQSAYSMNYWLGWLICMKLSIVDA